MLNLEVIQAPSEFHYLPETTSTMDVAAQLARQGADHLTTIFAEVQTRGRGRRGRVWEHFAECNIAMTVILREGMKGQLALLVSLALQRALQPFVQENIYIKWPNDLFLQDKKLAGILVEQGSNFALLGIGINVNKPLKELPSDFPGISLQESAGKTLKREQVISAVLASISEYIATYEEQGWSASIAADYKEACCTIGSAVVWHSEGNKVSGLATGLNKEGALELTTADGTTHTVYAGDIVAEGKKHT
ncbi:MAG: biotin--[acetyl-CoA-carboxylase] ligase [Alphaproteobacteria bacterium]|nr:biotin--[acetyl-CoA-carboxylase] ligase [Alphaproteobacteria bacterium]